MGSPSKNDQIEYLVQQKYPNETKILSQEKKNDTGCEDQKAAAKIIEKYKTQLESWSPAQIQGEYEKERERERRLLYLRDTRVDFEHWAKADYWTLDEAIALVFGIDPDEFGWEEVTRFSQESVGASEIVKARELARRAIDRKKISEPVTPHNFIVWAKSTEIRVPKELIRLVEARGGDIANCKERLDEAKTQITELKKQLDQLKAALDNAQPLMKSDYWLQLTDKALRAVKEYPAWRDGQSKVQKTGNLKDWVIETIGAETNREAELLLKVLTDFFQELK